MKIKKILIILLSFILLFFTLQNISIAAGEDGSGDGIADIKSAMTTVKDGTSADDSEKIENVINIVIGLLQVAGTGLALIVITMLGIKYLLASPSEKADVKKQIMPIIIGCILLFGALQLMGAVYEFSQDVFSTGN